MVLDDEIKEKIFLLPDPPEIIDDMEFVIDDLSNNFQWIGSKIDWTNTNNHKMLELRGNYSNWVDEINCFIRKNNIDEYILRSSDIFYINDSSLDFSVKLNCRQFYPFLEMAIKNIPQHHYFFDKINGWCFVISSEGYADFGFSLNINN
ncbi:type IV secretion protein Rhs [Pantoea sp. FN0302]|uniref:type IV secretion protein Rhs n=1 Tax=Pantoea sp. FN0302 TaxID=3418558 RepID=UPI003CE7B8BD